MSVVVGLEGIGVVQPGRGGETGYANGYVGMYSHRSVGGGGYVDVAAAVLL